MVTLGLRKRGDGVIQYVLTGEFDLADVAAVESAITAGRRESDTLVLDSRGVSFMDSSALALLLRLQRHAAAGGWSISHATSTAVMSRVERMGLAPILTWAEVDPANDLLVPPRA